MSRTVHISNFGDVEAPSLELPPGMISESERRFLYWLASSKHTGAGEIVEIGTWLGCSTMHLAAGLRDAGRGQKLYSHDDYIWRPGMAEKSGLTIEEGASFFPNFLGNVESLRSHIEPKVASAIELGWTDGKIETLVIDAPKSWRTIRRLFKQLAPFFIPGKTRIAFQDYLHFPSYELAIYVASLDVLEPQVVVLEGSTVMFLVTDEVPEERVSDLFSYKKFDAAQIDRLWRGILGFLPKEACNKLALAYPLTLWQLGHHSKAEARLAEMELSREMTSFMLKKSNKNVESHFTWIRSAVRSRYGLPQ